MASECQPEKKRCVGRGRQERKRLRKRQERAHLNEHEVVGVTGIDGGSPKRELPEQVLSRSEDLLHACPLDLVVEVDRQPCIRQAMERKDLNKWKSASRGSKYNMGRGGVQKGTNSVKG